MSIELFTRYFLGIYFLLIGVLFTTRTLGLGARTGYSHINYGNKGSLPWWNRHLFNVFRAAILVICLSRIFYPIDPWLGIIQWLYHPPVMALGIGLLLISFGAASYIQAYLNADWRSGIDHQYTPELVIFGPYQRSRNPAFLAIITGQAGFFLALPSIFSLVCLIAGVLVLWRQAKAEEAALSSLHGEPYRQYREKVPRWF